jgi:hypothetical protein
MFGGLIDAGQPADVVEAMTIDRLRFVWNCLMAYREAVKEAG